jgi:hypothetical protein
LNLSGPRPPAEADLVLWLTNPEHETNLPRESTAPIWLVRNKVDLDSASSGA